MPNRGKSNDTDSLLYRFWLKTRGEKAKEEEEQGPAQPDLSSPAPCEQAVQDALSLLWREWNPRSSCPGLYDALSAEERSSGEVRRFGDRIAHEAKRILSMAESAQEQCMDASVMLGLSGDLMSAWIFVFPPRAGGKMLDREMLEGALRAEGISYGIQEDMVLSLTNGERYFQILPIARGLPARNGEDGKLYDNLLAGEASEQKNAEGKLEYISFCMVKKGDVICRASQPTEPVDGISVKGAKVRGIPGKPVQFPRVPNTVLSPQGDALIAAIDGRIAYNNNSFVVDNVLVIGEDVNVEVGDIEYDGDVLVQGDIREGHMVRATGDVLVRGMVENVIIIAGGNITLEQGMNGNGEGRLEAQGEIRTKFLENCTAWAKGSIYAESIICSDVASDDSIYAVDGPGVIIGGSCTALRLIRAQRIGTKSYRETVVANGCSPQLLRRCMQAEQDLDELQKKLDGVVKDTAFLEGQTELSVERKKLLGKLRLDRSVLRMKEKRLSDRLSDIRRQIDNAPAGRIECQILYPNTKVVIGNASLTINSTYRSCVVRLSGGAITVDI